MHIRRLLLLVGLYLCATLAAAASRVAVFSDGSTIGTQLQQRLLEALPQSGLAEATTGEAVGDLAVAIGPQGLQQALRQSPARQVIAVMITRTSFDEVLAAQIPRPGGREVHAVLLDQPPARYLDLIRLALPQGQRLGLLFSRGVIAQQKQLEKLAAERGLTVNAVGLQEDLAFIAQLERLLAQSDVLLALPDAVVHNRNTVQPLLLATYRAGVPVVAYSEAYTQAGALLSLYSTPAQLARQTVELAVQMSQGRVAARYHPPRYFTVSVNAAVARSLGLTLPPAETLHDRLQQVGE